LRKSRKYLVVGWFWYLIMLLPVIGIIQVNLQAHADRYTYLPQIGLLILIAWTFGDALTKKFNVGRLPAVALTKAGSAFGVCCAVPIILALAFVARLQVFYWRDSETLWTHTIAVTRNNYFAHASLADLLMRQGRVTEAIGHSEEALRIRPGD